MLRPALCLLLLTLSVPAAAGIAFEPALPGPPLEDPVQVVPAPDHSGRLYVVEQTGRIFLVRPGRPGRSPALDLRGRVRLTHAEEGLLSLAFDPGFRRNHRAYVWYSVPGAGPRRNRLARFQVDPRSGALLPAGQRTLLEIQKRWGNHNGSCLRFGPDGDLYLGVGDGGGAGDPMNNAQNTDSLLGKMLRLDVDRAPAGRPYGVPAGNPFARGGGRPEIFAWGLRNPWRMAFDPATGALWVADVGQDLWEEIDVVEKGRNYGWNWREGAHAYRRGAPPPGLVDPVFDYGHSPFNGGCVIGGVVVRSGPLASLRGRYLFADFLSRRFWSLDADTRARSSLRYEGRCPQPPVSMDESPDGTVWVCGYGGTVYRLREAAGRPKRAEPAI